MAYTDSLFLTLFAAIFVTNVALRSLPTIREWLLTAFSALLIASWGLVDLGLLVGMLLVNFLAVRGMLGAGPRTARIILSLTITADLGALALFKYANFLSDAVGQLIESPLPRFPLGIPLAISFYTFHLISYLIDVHRGRVASTTFSRYVFYVTFFPHVIAGPIVRAWQLVPQVGRRRHVPTDLPVGLHQLATGFFLKSVAADNIAGGIDPVWAGTTTVVLSAADRWLVAFLYYCQIYADFAGYSLMALGMARLLGYRLPANFRTPMLATSLQEFWRRWHITLSRWLRDYLYIPLGGSRHGRFRTALSIMATMLLGGLWHGAGWGFIIWGSMHGLGLALERLLGRQGSGRGRPGWLAWWLLTQVWVTLAWIFFRSPDLRSIGAFFTGMIGFAAPGAWRVHGAISGLLVFAIPVVLHHCAPMALRLCGHRHLGVVLGVMTGVLLLLDIVVASPIKTFIYFRF